MVVRTTFDSIDGNGTGLGTTGGRRVKVALGLGALNADNTYLDQLLETESTDLDAVSGYPDMTLFLVVVVGSLGSTTSGYFERVFSRVLQGMPGHPLRCIGQFF